MTITDSELEFAHHLRMFGEPDLLHGETEQNAYQFRSAEEMHVYCVVDAIRDLHLDAIQTSFALRKEPAADQMRFGVARRTKFIWLSLRELFSLAYPDRTEPLPGDDVERCAQALNEIYINIRGTLDNLARSLLLEFREMGTDGLSPMEIGLFHTKVRSESCLPGLSDIVEKFDDWNRELREKRDPAAHRIPLSVPPTALTPDAQEEYDALCAQWTEAANAVAGKSGEEFELARGRADALHDALERVGQFLPLFVHDPAEKPIPIYPTVPGDVGALVRVSRQTIALISRGLST